MSVDAKSSGFIFGLTLTELIIITFFILFLLMTNQLADQEEEIAKLTDKQAATAQEQEQFEKSLEDVLGFPIDSEAFFRELVNAKNVADMAREKDVSPEAVAELRREKEQLEVLSTTQQGQLKVLQERAEGSGDGIPPCWVAEDGTTEYMFSVLIKDSKIFTSAVYPAYRTSEFRKIPDVHKLEEANGVTIEYFLKNTKAAFEESKRRNPECRFYVRIYDDSSDLGKFKPMLVKVQNHFYPYLGINVEPPTDLLARARAQERGGQQAHEPAEGEATGVEVSKTEEPRECDAFDVGAFSRISKNSGRRAVERKLGLPCWAAQDTSTGEYFWYFSADSAANYIRFNDRYRVIETVP